MTYDQVLERLEQIERDLAERQEEFEQAAEDKFRHVREYELRHAQLMATVDGPTATEKKAQAIVAIAAAGDGLYQRVTTAEARYEALRAAVKVLEQRAMIGMALLKSMTRETGPAVAWSRTA